MFFTDASDYPDPNAFDEATLTDGYSATEVFSNSDCVGITFDDLICLPGAIDFAVFDVELSAG
jgi:hypothetical protein